MSFGMVMIFGVGSVALILVPYIFIRAWFDVRAEGGLK